MPSRLSRPQRDGMAASASPTKGTAAESCRSLLLLLPPALWLDVQIRLVEHLALVEFEEAHAFARLHLIFARGGVDLRLHFAAEILLLVLHAFDHVGDAAAAQRFFNVET